MRKYVSIFFVYLFIFLVGIAVADNGSLTDEIALEELNAFLTPSKDEMLLRLNLRNGGDHSMTVVPGKIYFPKGVLENYQGTVKMIENSGEDTNAKSAVFSKGEKIQIPSGDQCEFAVEFDINLNESFSRHADINWHFDVNDMPVNYAAEIDFTQSKTVDQKTKNDIETENSTIHFYTLVEPVMPKILPATGLSQKDFREIKEKPAVVKYQDLKGLHLEIPVIDAEMDLVRIPLNENNEWNVKWLTDQAGVLSAGALPGMGTSVIAAHNHLDAENSGPFNMLQNLSYKDRIFVTDSKGKLSSYAVYANKLLKPDEGELLYDTAIPGSLVLVTCESEIPEGGYAFRRVIYAEPLQ